MNRFVTSIVCATALAGGMALGGCRSRSNVDPGPIPHQDRRDRVERDREREAAIARGELVCETRAFPTGDRDTSVIELEKCSPATARANQEFEYTIRVTNLTEHPLRDVRVTDEMRGGLAFVSAEPGGEAGENDSVTWTFDTLGPGESQLIRARARAPEAAPAGRETDRAAGDTARENRNGRENPREDARRAARDARVGNCATVSYSEYVCTDIEIVEAELEVTKSGPSEVLICENIPYEFTVTNSGTAVLNDVRISDPLPEGLTNVNGGRTIVFNVGTLEPGQRRSFAANAVATQRGSFTNQVAASGGGVEAESGEVTTVVREPVLEISKTGPQREFIGRDVTYQITVRNTGDGEARDTVITDTISADTGFVRADNNGRRAGNRVVWNVGTIQPRGEKTVSVTLTREREGEIRNTASATAYCAQEVRTSEALVTRITGIPAILIEVVDLEDPVRVGNETTYSIRVTNQGSAVDTDVRLVVELDAAQEYVRSTGPTRASTAGPTVTFAPIASLDPQAQASYTVVVRAVAPGDVRFRVQLTSNQLTSSVLEEEATNQYE